jgi:hypothetical protein
MNSTYYRSGSTQLLWGDLENANTPAWQEQTKKLQRNYKRKHWRYKGYPVNFICNDSKWKLQVFYFTYTLRLFFMDFGSLFTIISSSVQKVKHKGVSIAFWPYISRENHLCFKLVLFFVIFVWCFETRSHCVAQSGLEASGMLGLQPCTTTSSYFHFLCLSFYFSSLLFSPSLSLILIRQYHLPLSLKSQD